MNEMISVIWPAIDTGRPQDAVPQELAALRDVLGAATGARILPGDGAGEADGWPDPAPGQAALVLHLNFPEGTILAYEAAVARGHEDSAEAFLRFASDGFARFCRFRDRWMLPAPAEGQLRLNLSHLRRDPEAALAQVLAACASDVSASALAGSSLAACKTLLERTDQTRFRHFDQKLFDQLHHVRLTRETVQQTFQELLERAPGDRDILFFQTMASVEQLRKSLMSSKEYLTRKGLSEEGVRLGYQLLLDRAPSAAEIDEMRKTQPDLDGMRRVLLRSPDFSRQYSRFVGESVVAGTAGSANRAAVASEPASFVSMPHLQPCHSDRVVFLHVPKCGGTTLHHMLIQWYGAENTHAERFNRLYGYTAAHLAASLLFSGHYDFYSTTLVPGPKKLISFLRDPLDRLISLYNFHRAHAPAIVERNNLQLPRWAAEHDIDDYFATPKIRAHAAIDNSIVRYFSDMPQISAPMADCALRNVTLDEMLDQALRNVERFAFVGFMDRYDSDMDRLAAVLKRDPPGQMRKHQVLDDMMESNPGMRKIDKQRPSPECRAGMEELVRYDRLFYARARELFA